MINIGKERVSLSEAVGRDGVIKALRNSTRYPELTLVRAELALTRGWYALEELIREGGAINLQGHILADDVNKLRFPATPLDRLQRELTFGVSPRQFQAWSGRNPHLEDWGYDWQDRDWGVHLVAKGFGSHLDFFQGQRRVIFLLNLPEDGRANEQSWTWLRTAMRNHMEMEYKQERVPRIIPVGIAVTQLLVDIVRKSGRVSGEIRTRK